MWGREGLYGRPLVGVDSLAHEQMGPGTRATIKAIDSRKCGHAAAKAPRPWQQSKPQSPGLPMSAGDAQRVASTWQTKAPPAERSVGWPGKWCVVDRARWAVTSPPFKRLDTHSLRS